MRVLLDPVLERTTKSLGPLRPAIELAMGFTLTTEVGVVLGYLAQRVLGQYELVLLDEAVEDRPPRLLFVLPNLGEAVANFGADEQEFMTWVTLHEVTHAVQFAGVPWLQGHVAGLVQELLRTAELRIEAPRKLRMPTGAELRRIVDALRHGDLISVVTDESERATLDRVQAVMAVIEGHAEHVMDAVAPDLLPSLPRLRAAIDRRRRSQKGLSRLLARLLGLDMKLRQYERGKYFCDAIVRARGVEALHHVFSSPEALPTLDRARGPRRLAEPHRPRRRRHPPPLERVEPPGVGHAAQRVHPAVVEREPRADHEVLDRARREHLAGARFAHHAGADVDRDPGDVAAHELALAGVQPGADVKAEPTGLIDDFGGAAHAAGRPVERREKAVADRLDLGPAPPHERRAHHRVVLAEELPPRPVPEARGVLGRADDVGEHHGREHAVDLLGRPAAGEELLDVVDRGRLDPARRCPGPRTAMKRAPGMSEATSRPTSIGM